MVNYEKEFEEFIFHVIERSSENPDVKNSNNDIHMVYNQAIYPKVHSISIKNEEYSNPFTTRWLLGIRIVLHRTGSTNEVITFETKNPKMMRAFEDYQKALISAKKISYEKDREEVNLIRQSISNIMDK